MGHAIFLPPRILRAMRNAGNGKPWAPETPTFFISHCMSNAVLLYNLQRENILFL